MKRIVLTLIIIILLSNIIITFNVKADPVDTPPTADAGGPYSAKINQTITFNASASTDPDGTITGYRWDWTNDDTYDTAWYSTPITTHSYSTSGSYTVKLEVKDNNGSYSNDTASVFIINTPQLSIDIPPTADAGGPYSIKINQTITFNASASTDPDGTITGYRWDWTNDEIYDTSWSSNTTATYIYTTIGTYTVNLQVKDNFGAAANDTALVTVSQENKKLQADAGGPYYEIVNISFEFEGTGSYSLNGNILTYIWSFGDGNTSTSIIPTHTYTKEGNYTVILTITDDNNNTDTDTTYVIVTKKPNLPPEIPTISGINSSHINTNCDYIIKTFDVDDDKIQYIINWGDGTNQTISPLLNSNTAFNTSHSWSTGGIYKITVHALDENNAISDNRIYIVLIDAYYCGSLGYLVDKNGDGTYDVFYYETTGKETNIQKNNSEYNIDINDDQKWDYKFNLTTNKISEYKTSTIQESSILNIVSKGIPLTIAAILLIIYLTYLIKLTKIKNENQQEKKPKLEIKEKYSPAKTNKIYTFGINDEKIKEKYTPTKTNKIYTFGITDEKIKNENQQEKKPKLEIKEKYTPTKTNKIYTFGINDEKIKKIHEEIDKILIKKGKTK